MSLCKTIVPASEIPDSVGVPVCLVRPGPEADDSTRVPRDGKGSPADALAAALEACWRVAQTQSTNTITNKAPPPAPAPTARPRMPLLPSPADRASEGKESGVEGGGGATINGTVTPVRVETVGATETTARPKLVPRVLVLWATKFWAAAWTEAPVVVAVAPLSGMASSTPMATEEAETSRERMQAGGWHWSSRDRATLRFVYAGVPLAYVATSPAMTRSSRTTVACTLATTEPAGSGAKGGYKGKGGKGGGGDGDDGEGGGGDGEGGGGDGDGGNGGNN